MSVKYKLVLKKDLTKGAAIDAKRYYASANVTGMMDFDTICDVVADRSTASDGDVALVLLGLIRCMQEALLRGEWSNWVHWATSGSHSEAPEW